MVNYCVGSSSLCKKSKIHHLNTEYLQFTYCKVDPTARHNYCINIYSKLSFWVRNSEFCGLSKKKNSEFCVRAGAWQFSQLEKAV